MRILIAVVLAGLFSGCAANGPYTMADYQQAMFINGLINQNQAQWGAQDAQINYNYQQGINRANYDYQEGLNRINYNNQQFYNRKD